MKFTTFCDLWVDFWIRLTTLRKSVRKFRFGKIPNHPQAAQAKNGDIMRILWKFRTSVPCLLEQSTAQQTFPVQNAISCVSLPLSNMAREDKPRFGAALDRSAQDCDAPLVHVSFTYAAKMNFMQNITRTRLQRQPKNSSNHRQINEDRNTSGFQAPLRKGCWLTCWLKMVRNAQIPPSNNR